MVARSLFAGLVDDAALFPPGNAPMARALAEHAAYRRTHQADLVGPFLCPASRTAELLETLPSDQQLSLSLVFDVTGAEAHAALGAVAADHRVTLVAVEAAQRTLGADAAVVGANLARLPGAVGCLEVPRTQFDDALDLVDGTGWSVAKYRTGGTVAESFPTEAELAAFLVTVASRAVPFKLTAGLHHAVRHTDPASGFEQHGLLNVLVATRVARQGGSVEAVTATLSTRDAHALVGFVDSWDEDACVDVRAGFRSFGCCGVTDPINDLATLGLLGGDR